MSTAGIQAQGTGVDTGDTDGMWRRNVGKWKKHASAQPGPESDFAAAEEVCWICSRIAPLARADMSRPEPPAIIHEQSAGEAGAPSAGTEDGAQNARPPSQGMASRIPMPRLSLVSAWPQRLPPGCSSPGFQRPLIPAVSPSMRQTRGKMIAGAGIEIEKGPARI